MFVLCSLSCVCVCVNDLVCNFMYICCLVFGCGVFFFADGCCYLQCIDSLCLFDDKSSDKQTTQKHQIKINNLIIKI